VLLLWAALRVLKRLRVPLLSFSPPLASQCVEAAYGICASTTTTNLNTYIETLAVDLQPSIQLLAANCVAGIILCCLHFIVSAVRRAPWCTCTRTPRR